MSFLAPLYLLGAAAIALPILFHMIRRTPRGRQEFSSVMFLEPSPPRITRRSRIEHWLLLLLRAAAVCLLAAAFARPFFRARQNLPLVDPDARQCVILVDTSASMRRETLWDEAVERVLGEVDAMEPADELCLMRFDGKPYLLVDFEQWNELEPAQRRERIRGTLRDIEPTSCETNLGLALIQAADVLDAAESRHASTRRREIVLVSDLQAGSRLDALQSYDWPREVRLRAEVVGDNTSPDNAGVHLFMERTANTREADARVRVSNAGNSTTDQFRLRWASQDSDARESTAFVSVTLAPGESRVVRMPSPSESEDPTRILLEGDDHDFDNTCFVHSAPVRSIIVGVLSADAVDDPQGMRYYIEPALPSTPTRNVNVVEWDFEAELPDEPDPPAMIIVTESLLPPHVESLREYTSAGGTVLLVPPTAEDCVVLYELLNVAPVPAEEAEVENYAMLIDIDYSHPLFASLDDPRFSDFTKLHIWHHRIIDAQALPNARILARFDDGSPAIVEVPLGAGRIVMFATGWHPQDSELALSTKFIPMLNALLESAAGLMDEAPTYHVGDSIPLADLSAGGATVTSVLRPDGTPVDLTGRRELTQTEQPGLYRVVLQDESSQSRKESAFVVNLSPLESRTDPLPPDALEAAGVQLSSRPASSPASEEAERQLRAHELEGRQKLWRWIVLSVIFLLLVETWLAGRLSRRHAS